MQSYLTKAWPEHVSTQWLVLPRWNFDHRRRAKRHEASERLYVDRTFRRENSTSRTLGRVRRTVIDNGIRTHRGERRSIYPVSGSGRGGSHSMGVVSGSTKESVLKAEREYRHVAMAADSMEALSASTKYDLKQSKRMVRPMDRLSDRHTSDFASTINEHREFRRPPSPSIRGGHWYTRAKTTTVLHR